MRERQDIAHSQQRTILDITTTTKDHYQTTTRRHYYHYYYRGEFAQPPLSTIRGWYGALKFRQKVCNFDVFCSGVQIG